MTSGSGNRLSAEEAIGEVIEELKAARGRLKWVNAIQGSERLNCPLLKADSYLQSAIEALRRAARLGA